MSAGLPTTTPPPPLRPGTVVGVAATSAWAAGRFPHRTRRAVAALERALGSPVRLAPEGRYAGAIAGTGRERARALLDLYADPDVGAVLTTIGGNNSNDLLEHLDELASLPPKILVGYSDNTALLLGCQAITGTTVFYGPALLPQFGEWPAPFPETVDHLRRTLTGEGGTADGGADGVWPLPSWWTQPYGDWASADEEERPRYPGGAYVLRPGRAEGVLFGGNVPTLSFLAGTRWLAPPDGPTVLCLEGTEDGLTVPAFQRSLTQLRHLGIAERATAVVVGRTPGGPYGPERTDALHRILLDAFPGDVPILLDLPFGHTDPMLTLPLGAAVRVEADGGRPVVRTLNPTVAAPAARTDRKESPCPS
ncbi:S66 peptidase family protein [Streptomyces sp. NPDC093546]|uniref:S66 family peptidase n=1 Tax=Streptomyces sp. NPDC093546 TaxID=3366040 RepID=UPI0037F9DE62